MAHGDWDGYIKLDLEFLSRMKDLTGDSPEEEWIDVAEEAKDKGYLSYVISERDPGAQQFSFPSKLWTLVHHASYHGVGKEVVEKLREGNFSLSLLDGEGRMACELVKADIADRDEIVKLLTPQYKV